MLLIYKVLGSSTDGPAGGCACLQPRSNGLRGHLLAHTECVELSTAVQGWTSFTMSSPWTVNDRQKMTSDRIQITAMPVCTHLSVEGLCQDVHAHISQRCLLPLLRALDRLRDKLRSLATRATTSTSGNKALIEPGVGGYGRRECGLSSQHRW